MVKLLKFPSKRQINAKIVQLYSHCHVYWWLGDTWRLVISSLGIDRGCLENSELHTGKVNDWFIILFSVEIACWCLEFCLCNNEIWHWYNAMGCHGSWLTLQHWFNYHQTSNVRCTLIWNKIYDHSHFHSRLNSWLQWAKTKFCKTMRSI